MRIVFTELHTPQADWDWALSCCCWAVSGLAQPASDKHSQPQPAESSAHPHTAHWASCTICTIMRIESAISTPQGVSTYCRRKGYLEGMLYFKKYLSTADFVKLNPKYCPVCTRAGQHCADMDRGSQVMTQMTHDTSWVDNIPWW